MSSRPCGFCSQFAATSNIWPRSVPRNATCNTSLAWSQSCRGLNHLGEKLANRTYGSIKTEGLVRKRMATLWIGFQQPGIISAHPGTQNAHVEDKEFGILALLLSTVHRAVISTEIPGLPTLGDREISKRPADGRLKTVCGWSLVGFRPSTKSSTSVQTVVRKRPVSD